VKSSEGSLEAQSRLTSDSSESILDTISGLASDVSFGVSIDCPGKLSLGLSFGVYSTPTLLLLAKFRM
jgi:hypothetical protein